METLLELLDYRFLGNPVRAWLLAALIFLVTFTVLPAIRGFIERRARARAAAGEQVEMGRELVSGLVTATLRLFLLVLALYFATRVLTLPAQLDRAVTVLGVLVFWLQVALWAVTATRFALDHQLLRRGPADAARAGSFEVLMFVSRLVIFTFAALLALDNLGVQIKPLLAGLGIGGIAIALAVQTVLGDLFASLSITLDKPFEIGDALLVDDDNGTVERIGIKSTRLRSLNGEQIVISNADLLQSRVHNFKRMRERRYAFTVAVTYETPRELLAEIPAIVEAAIRAQPQTRFDRCHLLRLGDSGLIFEVVYIVTEPDYRLFADTQQAINFRLLEEFGERGIEFAYPTQRNISEARRPVR
ncbi:MAG TPA: mechanosensitive ion channel family protein [Steroidobacteraceae bacterium]|nr:mechanosensitive ion channel family protein [Steroidobacteraceae bacterium]HNS27113.1 mechanosensitive ion channel family protein [Steroidobacteraceae bacterium]